MNIKYNTILFISGMFRSGTTLLARMLNAHSHIVLASDPLFEFFKSFRNEVYRQNNIQINSDTPLGANFKSDHNFIKKQIENADFTLDMKFTNLDELSERIKKIFKTIQP